MLLKESSIMGFQDIILAKRGLCNDLQGGETVFELGFSSSQKWLVPSGGSETCKSQSSFLNM